MKRVACAQVCVHAQMCVKRAAGVHVHVFSDTPVSGRMGTQCVFCVSRKIWEACVHVCVSRWGTGGDRACSGDVGPTFSG